jgi:putative transposase
VYIWADGVHFRVRLEQARLCCLVIVGVRADGTKELVAVADGERESTGSWAEVLCDLRRRGMQAPVVAVGDGALGLWAALRDVFPATRHQRDWVHKAANVLSCVPKAVQAGARTALAESATPPTVPTPSVPARSSPATTGPSGPRPWPRSPTTPRNSSPSSTTRPSTGAPEDQQPDRVDLRHGPAANSSDQGSRFQGRGAGDGVQAAGGRPGPLASGQRPPPGRAGACRRPLRQGSDDRASRQC